MVSGQAGDEGRITGHDLMPFTKDNVDIVIAHLKELHAAKTITYAKLLDDTRIDKTASSLSRWVSRRVSWDAIGKSAHEAIVRYLTDKHHWHRSDWQDAIDTIPDALFHAASSFLDISHATKDKTRRRAKGVFRVYYPSLVLTGRYVVGAAWFQGDPQTDVVKISLVFRYQPDDSTTFETRPTTESYDGFLFRKSKKYFSLLRDSEKTHLRMEVYPDTFRVDEDIKILRGAVMSMSENRSFHAPIYYEKRELAQGESESALFERTKEEANIYDADDIPEIIRAYLGEAN